MTNMVKKKCEFCKQPFTTNKKTKFCSAICMHDQKRATIYKKLGRGPSYEYICRRIVVGNSTGDVYGITIPRELVEQHNLFGKKFKIKISKTGIFSIKTKIEYIEMKGR